MTPGKDRQRAYHQRKTARYAAMEAALAEISAILDGNDKPLAAQIRAIALKARQ